MKHSVDLLLLDSNALFDWFTDARASGADQKTLALIAIATQLQLLRHAIEDVTEERIEGGDFIRTS